MSIADYEIRHDMGGYYICTTAEAEHEDEGHASVGFDGRPHYATMRQAEKVLRLALEYDRGESAVDQ